MVWAGGTLTPLLSWALDNSRGSGNSTPAPNHPQREEFLPVFPSKHTPQAATAVPCSDTQWGQQGQSPRAVNLPEENHDQTPPLSLQPPFRTLFGRKGNDPSSHQAPFGTKLGNLEILEDWGNGWIHAGMCCGLTDSPSSTGGTLWTGRNPWTESLTSHFGSTDCSWMPDSPSQVENKPGVTLEKN